MWYDLCCCMVKTIFKHNKFLAVLFIRINVFVFVPVTMQSKYSTFPQRVNVIFIGNLSDVDRSISYDQ